MFAPIDKYIANLKDNILLNKDADIVIERIKQNNA
jgi:hypothetical protein